MAFPTETVYGLGADASNVNAVRKIFELKGRPFDHPLIVHLHGAAQLSEWAAEVPPEAHLLAERFWPGPLTLVLKSSPRVQSAVTGGQTTVALRSPSHEVARALLKAFGGGLAAPSANRFGRVSPTTARHVAGEFGEAGAELLILDGGRSEVGLESTILDLSMGAPPRLLRPGGVPVAALERVMGAPLSPSEASSAPRAPGSLASHYAASAPSRLVAGAELVELARRTPGAAVLAVSEAPAQHAGAWRRLPLEPAAYGRELYAALRELDAAQPSVILIEEVPSSDEWLAVRDRLERATAAEGGAASGPGS